jgi:hypothetical protein
MKNTKEENYPTEPNQPIHPTLFFFLGRKGAAAPTCSRAPAPHFSPPINPPTLAACFLLPAAIADSSIISSTKGFREEHPGRFRNSVTKFAGERAPPRRRSPY